MVKRKSLICYYENESMILKVLENQNVNITYNSPKHKYLVIYFDADRLLGLKSFLAKQKCVLEVIESEIDMDSFDF